MNPYSSLIVRREPRLHLVTLARPERLNALDPTMLHEIIDAVRAADRDGANAIVLRAEGRAFCAGVDVRSPYFMEGVEEESVFVGTRLLNEQHELIRAIYDSPCVTIAAVNGDAVGGGGFGMVMACDLRFAVQDARFWLVPAQLNLVQDYGVTWSLQRAIGTARTVEMAFTGRRVDAATGEAWGFLNSSFVDQQSLDHHVSEVSRTIAEVGTDSARLLKHVIRSGQDNGLDAQLRLEAVANGLCFQSGKFLEARRDLLGRVRDGQGE